MAIDVWDLLRISALSARRGGLSISQYYVSPSVWERRELDAADHISVSSAAARIRRQIIQSPPTMLAVYQQSWTLWICSMVTCSEEYAELDVQRSVSF